MFRTLLALLALWTMLVGCAQMGCSSQTPNSASAPAQSGVYGNVGWSDSSSTDSCSAAQPLRVPVYIFKGTRTLQTGVNGCPNAVFEDDGGSDGSLVAIAEPDMDGNFQISLPPGSYTVAPCYQETLWFSGEVQVQAGISTPWFQVIQL